MPAPFLLRETVACTMPSSSSPYAAAAAAPPLPRMSACGHSPPCQCHERFGEPYPVHIVSLPCVALPDGAVHGAYPFGCRVNLVEVVHDGPFVGSGDVEPSAGVPPARPAALLSNRAGSWHKLHRGTFPAEHLCEPFRRERVGEGITDESERTHGKGVRKRI